MGQSVEFQTRDRHIEGLLVRASPPEESLRCVVSKTLYPLLSTGSTQEHSSRHD